MIVSILSYKLLSFGSTFLNQIFHLSSSTNSITSWAVHSYPLGIRAGINVCFIHCCMSGAFGTQEAASLQIFLST